MGYKNYDEEDDEIVDLPDYDKIEQHNVEDYIDDEELHNAYLASYWLDIDIKLWRFNIRFYIKKD